MIKFLWQYGSPSGYRDCFPDLSLFWEMWKVVNRHKSAAHTDLPDVTHALAEVCNVPVPLVRNAFLSHTILGTGMTF